MNVTVDSEGMSEFFSALDGGMRSATGAAAAVYQTELKRIMQRNRGGLPSGPGEPPAVQTGRLSQSIAYNIVAPNRAEIGTNVFYGAYLEFGTSKMDARPWLFPVGNDRRVAGKARDAAAAQLERAIASAKSGAISAAKAGGP